ncbi:hypothetical protein DSLASN_43710 [Desulfoluna limicola]|uniref:Uncharacterized protein n=1 Tax=Desulfoluna limicola TaxID=2810562 RepID=A0ABM7PMP1_9BACT|nr:hypothetical protein DSLASN_43710 [Desulfoluna limicola]
MYPLRLADSALCRPTIKQNSDVYAVPSKGAKVWKTPVGGGFTRMSQVALVRKRHPWPEKGRGIPGRTVSRVRRDLWV